MIPPLPWQTFESPNADQAYVAVLTYLPLKRYRMIPRFLLYLGRVLKQLSKSRGAIGYSLLAHPLKLNFWTLSVWTSDEDLAEFVRRNPHAHVAQAMTSQIDAARMKFLQWKVKGSAVPVSWTDALRRFRL